MEQKALLVKFEHKHTRGQCDMPMKWSKEAEEAISRVPFFVRRRVRKKVEEEAVRLGDQIVTMQHVNSCRRHYLENMDQEVKGFQLETCFGPAGCPNRAVVDPDLIAQVERVLTAHNLREFLRERVGGPLKLHHEFRVSISDCPNACSRPQIADVGIIGALAPILTEEPCSQCFACVEACKEEAISLPEGAERPIIDRDKCVLCGQCVRACPTGTWATGAQGYRFLVGGKLGRHPQLATEIPGIRSASEVLSALERCLEHYKQHNRNGERFGEVLNRTGYDFLLEPDALAVGASGRAR